MKQVSIEDLVSELEIARELALHSGRYNSAISATLGKAKLLGLDRVTSNKNDSKPVKVTFSILNAKLDEHVEPRQDV